MIRFGLWCLWSLLSLIPALGRFGLRAFCKPTGVLLFFSHALVLRAMKLVAIYWRELVLLVTSVQLATSATASIIMLW